MKLAARTPTRATGTSRWEEGVVTPADLRRSHTSDRIGQSSVSTALAAVGLRHDLSVALMQSVALVRILRIKEK